MKDFDLPVVERDVVRVIVMDIEDRILLFRIREPLYPEEGICWELPGGGIDPGETIIGAALRELSEETGVRADPRDVKTLNWRRRVTFRHARERRLQNEVVAIVRLNARSPEVDEGKQLADEKDIYLGYRWWSLLDVEASTERFYPGTLPRYLRRALEGEKIEEPFESFS
jgi:8-oxo-dGTP pyrophosphatase MutT (NUDIX family)